MADMRIRRTSAILAAFCVFAFIGARAAGRDIYPAPGQARIDLGAALAAAAATHKRVILDFGGNWCTDCRVLDAYFNDSANLPIIEASYILVHVNIGRMNENLDIAERYQIPLRKGVPALAVLGESGELLYSQRTGEFQAMRAMRSSAVSDFLEDSRIVQCCLDNSCPGSYYLMRRDRRHRYERHPRSEILGPEPEPRTSFEPGAHGDVERCG
jgi:thioredoxin 1